MDNLTIENLSLDGARAVADDLRLRIRAAETACDSTVVADLLARLRLALKYLEGVRRPG